MCGCRNPKPKVGRRTVKTSGRNTVKPKPDTKNIKQL
jgi:hypothetical protein